MGVIAKSEWRGGEQKKLEKLEFDMPSISTTKKSFLTLNLAIGCPSQIFKFRVRS